MKNKRIWLFISTKRI